MILSVSRRTDIPAFYSEWFFNRLKEGFVFVRNPMNIHQVSRVTLSPEAIDCIVFWSKNPKPMLTRLDELKGYLYYFQFTINPYDKELELGVPRKEGIISTFKELSEKIGKKRVIWRYDPIILTGRMGVDYHVRYFEEIAKRLEGYTETCVISFVDLYQKTRRNLKDTTAREPSHIEMVEIASKLCTIAKMYGITIQTCAEEIELDSIGIKHGKCIDSALIEDLLGVKMVVGKDPNQRKECGCVQSIDIGEYNTCSHGCKYCYANFKNGVVSVNRAAHNPDSPLLIGNLGPEDKVTERKMVSFIKIPEKFSRGDIVKLEHPEMFKKTSDFHEYVTNLYKILTIGENTVNLCGVQQEVPKSEIKPVNVDGVEDRWIYYNPIIAASIVFPGEEVPAHKKDYSYYMDAFEHCYDEKKTYKELITNAQIVYVHEVQHMLRKRYQDDFLVINESKMV